MAYNVPSLSSAFDKNPLVLTLNHNSVGRWGAVGFGVFGRQTHSSTPTPKVQAVTPQWGGGIVPGRRNTPLGLCGNTPSSESCVGRLQGATRTDPFIGPSHMAPLCGGRVRALAIHGVEGERLGGDDAAAPLPTRPCSPHSSLVPTSSFLLSHS